MAERVDIVVVGAGPAGSTVAMLLARGGCRVALLDRGPGRFEIGETLPPQVSPLLADLGLFDRFCAQGHRRSPGTLSAWGSAEPACTDFLFSPHGDGWHVDRPALNRLLRDAAIDAGATFVNPGGVDACVRSRDGWTVRAGGREYDCQILVDATGRRSSARLPYGQRRTYDRLVSVAGVADPDTGARHARSDYTLVESVEHGWFYSALVPSGRYVVTFTTDADILATGRAASGTYLDEQLSSAPLTRARTRRFPRTTYAFSAASTRRESAADDRWIAVGDAARSYDPVCGRGVWKAIKGATDAVNTIEAIREGNPVPIDEYNRAHKAAFAKYLESNAAYYAMERRWPDSPFWARRHVKLKPMRNPSDEFDNASRSDLARGCRPTGPRL